MEYNTLHKKSEDFLKSLKDTFSIFVDYLYDNTNTLQDQETHLKFLKLLVDHDTAQYDLLNFQISKEIQKVKKKPSQQMKPIDNCNQVQNGMWFADEVYLESSGDNNDIFLKDVDDPLSF